MQDLSRSVFKEMYELYVRILNTGKTDVAAPAP